MELRNIGSYSKKRKIELINDIEKLNWDTRYNPEEFINLLISDNQRLKNWAIARLISILPYRTVRMIITKEYLIKNLNDKVYSQIFPLERKKNIEEFYKRLNIMQNIKILNAVCWDYDINAKTVYNILMTKNDTNSPISFYTLRYKVLKYIPIDSIKKIFSPEEIATIFSDINTKRIRNKKTKDFLNSLY